MGRRWSRLQSTSILLALLLMTFGPALPGAARTFIPPALRHTTADFGGPGAALAVTPSLLHVTTSIDVQPTWGVPAQILVDGIPRDQWGLSWVKIDPGTHVVSFTDVPGLTTAGPMTVTTVSGQATDVQGVFGARGYLRVITDPALPSTISVDGTPRDDWGMWMAVPPGTYTVSFGAVAGYVPPPDATAVVQAYQLTTITGTFTADSAAKGPDPLTYGLLRVTTQTDDGVAGVGTQILVDGVPRDEWGLSWVKIAPGSHTVAFTDVPGLGSPAPQTVTVTAAATTVATGTFARYGSLRVVTDPALAATVSVDGVPRDDWGMWMAMPAGSHTVSFEAVSGMTAPTAQVVRVNAGALTQATGEYAASLGSLNWAGYAAASDFTAPKAVATAVQGSWIVPTVQATSKTQYSSVWVGIGGFFQGDGTLIQTGTEEDSGSGSTFYAAWYELIPNVSIRITNAMTSCAVLPTTNYCLVKPGDAMSAAVSLKDQASNLWTIVLADGTQGWTFSIDVTYASSEQSAEWIVERPALCNATSCKLTTLASFTNVTLGQDGTNVADTNTATLGGYHGTLGAFPRRVVLMYSGQTLLAQPSGLSPDATSFLVTKLA